MASRRTQAVSVNDFFDLSKDIESVRIPGTSLLGREKPDPNFFLEMPLNSNPLKGYDYVKHYKEEEERALLQGMTDQKPSASPLLLSLPNSQASQMCEMEDLTSVGTVPNVADLDLDTEDPTQVYKKYDFSPQPAKGLQIEKLKDIIVKMIKTNQVLIIQGSTGCGKTTQVPQYILESHARANIHCNIIVTQPRRIAATSVAKRVCDERGWELQTLVGYQIGLDNKTSPETRLTYCTTGVLLQKLVSQRSMTAYTHVILDEVHERDQDMDFLLLVVRKLLRTNSRNVKVILMSATYETPRFSEYFSTPVSNKLEPAPVLHLEKASPFLVQEFYLDQLEPIGPLPEILLEEPGIQTEGFEVCLRLIKELDDIDFKEYKESHKKMDPPEGAHYKGAVLIFLPGIHEIEEMNNVLEEESERKGYKWHILPLHSSITKEEQLRVFLPPLPDCRKVILSTNIAESSITVPDVKYVLDFCLTKHLVTDPRTNFTSLQIAWASRTNCIQRAGRAGRTMCGRVYRFVPRDFYEDYMDADCLPEMLRCPLERTVLKTKLLRMGEPKALLALSLDPPDLSNLEKTILVLKEVGAMLLTSEGKESIFDGDITFMGRVMAMMPIDIRMVKLILFGHMFAMLEDTIIIAACMSVQNLFSTPFQKRFEAYTARLNWSAGSCSDCITLMQMYKTYINCKRTNYFRNSKEFERDWAKRSFLNLRGLREIGVLIEELKKRLFVHGITDLKVNDRVKWTNEEKPVILKVLIAGAFYPNYFVRGALGGQVDEREAVRVVSGRDPFHTVYLQGLPADQPGELYVRPIKDALKLCCPDMRMFFDGSSKVYVEFKREELNNKHIPGKVSMAVYRAVKMRQLRMPITLHLLPVVEAKNRMEKLGLTSNRMLYFGKEKSTQQSRLPGLDTQTIAVSPSWVITPNHFWIHSAVDEDLQWMMEALNKPGNVLPIKDPASEVHVGNIYAAPYTFRNNTFYYRVQVACFPALGGEQKVQALFVDYGNTDVIPISKLRAICPELIGNGLLEMPPLALECTLKGIKPLAKSGHWSDQSVKKFQEQLHCQLFGEVYSVVDGIISLELWREDSQTNAKYSINQWLIKEKYAEEAKESYRSEENHKRRLAAIEYSDLGCTSELSALESDNVHNFWTSGPDVQAPSYSECTRTVVLRGPISPLEMKVHGSTHISRGRDAQVEFDSVNSVLLDTDPEDPHDRLLVAGSVAQNSAGTKLKLRHTTIMPNIHGLPALLCMIFAPTIELRCNANYTKYTGMICGLGYNKRTKEALFAENDIEMAFDCKFTLKDFIKVNILRSLMNTILATRAGEDVPDITPQDTLLCQKKLREVLNKLLMQYRKSEDLVLSPRPFKWGLIQEDRLLLPDSEDGVFRMHEAIFFDIDEEEEEDDEDEEEEEEDHKDDQGEIEGDNV